MEIALLAGIWDVRRRLLDRRSGRAGEFVGTASFERDRDRLRWIEHGRIRFGGHDGPAGRRLSIVPAPEGWMVEFDDGRPFHPLVLDRAVEHVCGDDRYVGEYQLRDPDTLEVRWRVSGPAKDLEIETTYRREP